MACKRSSVRSRLPPPNKGFTKPRVTSKPAPVTGKRVFLCLSSCHTASRHTSFLLVVLLVCAGTNKPDTNTTVPTGAELALTDTFMKNTKHSGKPAGDKHSDGGGMYRKHVPLAFFQHKLA